MGRVLPVLFNGEMVRAVLEGRKTVTRRVIKFPVNRFTGKVPEAGSLEVRRNTLGSETVCFTEKPFYGFDVKQPYHPGDILYVRETWAEWTDGYIYRTWISPFPQPGCYPTTVWHPSIHMPREAARIWLKVTNVKVERLKDIDTLGCRREGIDITGHGVFKRFSLLWDSTIRKADTGRYGWDANPWVWVIGFERCEKPEVEN